jgi:sugar O-acyltransferase (sialic acid O-acetyltransferase NeuD family)
MGDTVPNRRRLFIISASHFGREMESWLNLIPQAERDWRLMGFLHTETDLSPLAGRPTDYRILGSWEDYPLNRDDFALVAVAAPAWKERIYNHLHGKLTFFTYIAPDAIIGKFSRIEEGSIICPKCIISTNVTVGKCVIINNRTTLAHDVSVGDFSSIMGSVNLNGEVHVGRRVFIGSKALVLPRIMVEDDSTVGAGSVVIKTVKQFTTVFGNPAKAIHREGKTGIIPVRARRNSIEIG